MGIERCTRGALSWGLLRLPSFPRFSRVKFNPVLLFISHLRPLHSGPYFWYYRLLYYTFSPFSFISLIADGPHHYHPACGHKGSSHLPPAHALRFFIAMRVQLNRTTRQPMVGFYLLTFPRFPLRKKKHKSYFGKNRTHDTSAPAGVQVTY